MIQDMLRRCDFATPTQVESLTVERPQDVARALTLAELDAAACENILEATREPSSRAPVLGITGTGGAGKSSLIDELVLRFLRHLPEDRRVAVLSVDPTAARPAARCSATASA
jgi:methylmalonyl-CoA mutase